MGDGGMAGQGSGRMEEGLQAARPGKQSLYTLCSGTVGSCPRAYIMLPPPCAYKLRTQSPRTTTHPDAKTGALTYLRLCIEHAPLTP